MRGVSHGKVHSLVKLLVSCSAQSRHVTPPETTSLNARNGVQIIEIIFYKILVKYATIGDPIVPLLL